VDRCRPAARIVRDLGDVFLAVPGRQHVQVGDDEETLELVLQAHPVLQATDVVPKMHATGGPVAGENAALFANDDASCTRWLNSPLTRPPRHEVK
jgi:hypothetical protein